MKHLVRTENRKRHTINACAVSIHGVFGAVHQGVQQSCRHITDVLALTGGEDDGEVDHHTPLREASDHDSHLAGIHQGLHLCRQRLVDLVVTKQTSPQSE